METISSDTRKYCRSEESVNGSTPRQCGNGHLGLFFGRVRRPVSLHAPWSCVIKPLDQGAHTSKDTLCKFGPNETCQWYMRYIKEDEKKRDSIVNDIARSDDLHI